jgi:hypothetical protein
LRESHVGRGLRLAAVLVGLLGLILTATPPAAAAAKPAGERFCGYVIDRLQKHEDSSRMLRQDCASSKKALEGELGVAADTLLLILYEHANFNTDGLVKYWYGAYGPCDSEGYGIRNISTFFFDINDKISSWQRGAASCSAVYMYPHSEYRGSPSGYWHWYYQVPYVGDDLNDKISSIHINYQP